MMMAVALEAGDEATARQALAARCGSELPWCTTWADAAARAREQRRPVLALVRQYRGLEVLDTTMLAPFMDEPIVELVAERFVPLKFRIGDDAPFNAPELYGIGGSAFGTSLLVLDAEGRVLGDTFTIESTSLHEFLCSTLPADGRPEPLATGEARLAQIDATPGLPPTTRAVRRAEVLGRFGRADEALALLATIPAGDAAWPAALFHRGNTLSARDLPAAQADWEELLRSHPESRWAWYAAALNEIGYLQLATGGVEPWPTAEELAAARPRRRATPAGGGSAADMASIERAAVRFLLDTQRLDGSFIFGGEVATSLAGRDLAMTRAITALVAQALLPFSVVPDADPRLESAIRRALGWLREAASRPTVFSGLAYDVWCEAALLSCAAGAIDAGYVDPDEWYDTLHAVTQALLSRQRKGGGFTYYGGADLARPDAALEISFSFVTAFAIRGLRGAQAMGIELPEGALERAVDCLARSRNDDGTFEYSLHHRAEGSGRGTAPLGAAGRGPLCSLELFRAGRADGPSLASSVEFFVQHRDRYAREQGKTLMHCGPQAEGSHYLLFDYWLAAEAARELEASSRAVALRPLQELVLAARCEDGSFVDNPIVGHHAGTAMALLALQALR
jgi:hypothetical protein